MCICHRPEYFSTKDAAERVARGRTVKEFPAGWLVASEYVPDEWRDRLGSYWLTDEIGEARC